MSQHNSHIEFNAREALIKFDELEDKLINLLHIADDTANLLGAAPVGVSQNDLIMLSKAYFDSIAIVHTGLSEVIPNVMIPIDLVDTTKWSIIENKRKDIALDNIENVMIHELDNLYKSLEEDLVENTSNN